MNTFRPALLAAAVIATVAAGAMGLTTFRAETREADTGSVCAQANWPLIPAECLDGAAKRSVRMVGETVAAIPSEEQVAMQARFETAFQ